MAGEHGFPPSTHGDDGLKIPFLRRDPGEQFGDVAEWKRAIHDAVRPFTMTGTARVQSVIDAIEYLVQADVPGDVVECGVWRGGSMMACAKTLQHLSAAERTLYLFDTFSGMTEPDAVDVDLGGTPARSFLSRFRKDRNGWCAATKDEVAGNMRSTGYPPERVVLVAGDVLETIPARAPARIALLRLDTDWYASTRHELDHLYERVSPRGIVIIDDYGHWQGARKAVDEFLDEHRLHVFLHRIDYTARLFVKPDHRQR
jgi:hypothetical protein